MAKTAATLERLIFGNRIAIVVVFALITVALGFVAARGLHIDDIDVVIHYEPAPEHKTYLHRSGRTARAGSKGLAVSLSIWNEELHMKRLQKRIGVEQPIVEMFSNDPRLDDLASWQP